MSTVSGKSSKHEKAPTELINEIQAIEALNKTLREHLAHLRTFRKSLITTNDNFKQLHKVNSQWESILKNMKS